MPSTKMQLINQEFWSTEFEKYVFQHQNVTQSNCTKKEKKRGQTCTSAQTIVYTSRIYGFLGCRQGSVNKSIKEGYTHPS